ncbi:MAG: hypothetical protein SPL52_00070 [Fibrobacter sp.]|nr:hypothetical protein [Fibrobacter sp.]
MKVKSIICALSLLVLCMGCSDKKEEPQSQQQLEQPVSQIKSVVPLDSSRIVSLKDFDPNDSISVGIRAFRAAKKEFVKRWNYTGENRWLLRVIEEICRIKRPCASRMDSVAYKADVLFVLDSLIRNKQLDSLVEMHKDRDYEQRNRDCSWANAPKGQCPEIPKTRIRSILDSLIKNHKGSPNLLVDSLKQKYKGQ